MVNRAGVLGLAAFAAALAAAPAANESPVADAAMRHDTAAVHSLLKQGADVNAAQGDGMTALHWAAMTGDATEARMLIAAGSRVESVTRNGSYTALHLAAKEGHSAVVKALLDGGANANAVTTSGGATALHFAAAVGNADAIIALLDHGAKVDALDGAWAETPLMWAADFDRAAAIEALVAHKADVKLVSRSENIPAREVADRTAQATRNRLVAAIKSAEQPGGGRGVPPGAGGPGPRGATAGAGAARGAASGAGRGAGGRGAPAQLDTTTPLSALIVAQGSVPQGRGSSYDTLNGGGGRALGYGDLVGNKGGLAALHFAARQGNLAAARALIKAGADINQLSADHTSPLLMAAINGHFDLAKELLAAHADPRLASDAGATPLYATINVQWAAKSLYPQPTAQTQQKTDYLALMQALLDAGADVNARLTKHLWYMSYNFDLLGVNTAGATPFWRAAYGTDVDAMKLLVKYGADPNIPTYKPAGRIRGDDAPAEDDSTGAKDPSGLPAVAPGGPGVYPIHAASGVGYGGGYAANAHRHAPDGWIPAVKYLIEELNADVNLRDFNGYTAMHNAAARGDNDLINFLVSKSGDVKVVSRQGQTTADMANGPVQRVPPFLETVKLLERLGAKNSHKCKSC